MYQSETETGKRDVAMSPSGCNRFGKKIKVVFKPAEMEFSYFTAKLFMCPSNSCFCYYME